MRYLKTYKLFESTDEEELDDVLDNITNLCLELKDTGEIDVDVVKNLEPSVITGKSPDFPLEVLIIPIYQEDSYELPTLEVSENIINTLQSLEYYLEQIDWNWNIQVYITEDVPEEEWGEKDIPLPNVYDVYLEGDKLIYDKDSNTVEELISQLVLKFKPTL